MSLLEAIREGVSGRESDDTRQAEFVAFAVDDKTETVLRRFVADLVLPHAFVGRGKVEDAIAMVSRLERSPRTIVVDISGAAMPLSDLDHLAEVCDPSVTVIVIGESNDVGLYRNLLRLGVQDYLTKPLTVDLLRRNVTPGGTASPVQQTRTGKVVATLGCRGGVGTTTVAVNMAVHLADTLKRRVALVDLDPNGGPVALHLGMTSNNGLIDVLQNVNRLDPQYMDRTLQAVGNRLFVLSAEAPYGAENTLPAEALLPLMEVLKQHFHYVILDLPTHSGAMAVEALKASSHVMLVADRSIYSAREAIRLMRYVELHDHTPSVALVLNNPQSPVKGRVESEDLLAAIDRVARRELPWDGAAAALAENLATPLVRGRSELGRALAALADDLAGRQEEETPSFLTRVMGQTLARWRR